MFKRMSASNDTLNEIDTSVDALPLPDIEFQVSPLLECNTQLLALNAEANKEDAEKVMATMTQIIQEKLQSPIKEAVAKEIIPDQQNEVVDAEKKADAAAAVEEEDDVPVASSTVGSETTSQTVPEAKGISYKKIYKRGALLWKKGKMDKSQPVDVILTETSLIGFKVKEKAKASKKAEEPKKAFEIDFSLGYVEHEIRGGTRDQTFTVHSRDTKQQIFLKAEDIDVTHAWVNAITARVDTTYVPYITHNKLQKPAPGFTGTIAKVGWLYVKSEKNKDDDFEARWCVLSDRAFAYYASPPVSYFTLPSEKRRC